MSMYFLDGKGELFPYYDKLNLTHFDWFYACSLEDRRADEITIKNILLF